MHKTLLFLECRAGLDRSAFHSWWLDAHRALVEQMPGLCCCTASLEADGVGAPFDGLAELWFDDARSAAAALASSPGRRFGADLRAHAARIERVDVAAHEFLDRGLPAPCKLIAALKRDPKLTRAQFASWWLERHAPLVIAFPELRRYCVNIVTDEGECFADGVAEVAFGDLETLRRITSSAEVKNVQGDSQVHTSARYRLLVVEHRILG